MSDTTPQPALTACDVCGAAVIDATKHNEWHAQLSQLPEDAATQASADMAWRLPLGGA